MTNTHSCKSMEHGEVWVVEDDDEWHLNINHVATEQDLEENSYLEEEGQTIHSVVLNILYCPYCGKSLSKEKDEIIPTFTFHDFSKW
ncbi:MAG TPA: hypothetical protein EYQ26_17020 [Rhodospirillales bacterium]|nr:hypothetical protein [Rhodospirillales bacterium]